MQEYQYNLNRLRGGGGLTKIHTSQTCRVGSNKRRFRIIKARDILPRGHDLQALSEIELGFLNYVQLKTKISNGKSYICKSL